MSEIRLDVGPYAKALRTVDSVLEQTTGALELLLARQKRALEQLRLLEGELQREDAEGRRRAACLVADLRYSLELGAVQESAR